MVIYCFIRVSLVLYLNVNQASHLKDVLLLSGFDKKVVYFLFFMSLGGLPPFLGFFSKIIVIRYLVSDGRLFWVSVLIAGSLVTLFFYMRLVVRGFLISILRVKSYVKGGFDLKFFYGLVSLNFLFVLFPLLFLDRLG